MQEADATVETFKPSIPPHLTLKELAVLGFLTLLALLFVSPVQTETTSSITPEQFRAWFDAVPGQAGDSGRSLSRRVPLSLCLHRRESSGDTILNFSEIGMVSPELRGTT